MAAEREHSLLRRLSLQYTNLDSPDISFLEDVAAQLPFIAELTGTDIFIDALASNGADAIVLAWARPRHRSLYRLSVVGEMAYATSEPAVYQVFSTGEIVRDVRGISQEGVPIAQTVVPLRNQSGIVVGVLIMERDISNEIRREEQVEFLSQTAESLSSTLMSLSMSTSIWEDWLGNGIFILNRKGEITYANRNAARMYEQYFGGYALGSDLISVLSQTSLQGMLDGMQSPAEFKFGQASYLFQAHPLVMYGQLSGCVISFQDVTELRQKERELNAQSAIIREIHHRVKNNLQNVVALLRLQMNRSDSAMVKTEFSSCINRILSISTVHDVFAHQSWDSINMLELGEYILSKLVEGFSLPGQQIKASVQGQAVRIPASQAVPIALVINELVTNSLKHGIRSSPYGEIGIFIEEAEGIVHLLVSDSGIAAPLGEEGQKGGLGLNIVNLLICEQLEGTFRLEAGRGPTVAKVSFRAH